MKTLERRLGLTSVIAISMGAMLGSGLFVLPGLAVALTGPSVWLAYLCAGLFVVPAALSKAELSTAMPISGGTYVYIDRAFGPLTGTIAGMGLWMSLLLKSAFALVGFGAYLIVLVDIPLQPTSLALLGAVVVINILGVRNVGKVQIGVVTIALGCLSVLAIWGLHTFQPELLDRGPSRGASGLFSAVAFVYISYAGVTKVAAIAEEVENPARNLPLGILLSLLVITGVYTVVTLVLVGNVPEELLHQDLHPIYTLGATIGGPGLGLVAAGLGVLTMTSMANSGLLAASRFPFAMSRDDLLPSILAKISVRFTTPIVSIVVTAALMACAILFLEVERIAKLAGSFMIVAFIAVNLTVVVLRESDAQWYKPPYKAPLYPFMQIAGVISGVVLLIMMGPDAVAAMLGMAVPGAIIFFAYGRQRTGRKGVFGRLGPRRELLVPTPQTLESALPGEAAAVVAVMGYEHSPEVLVEVGAALAGERKVEVLHLTSLPEQIDMGVMLEDEPAVRSLRRRVDAMAEVRGFDLEFDATVTRDVLETINNVSGRVHCDWLVMEWRGRAGMGISLVNPLGWLVNHLSANLAFYTDRGVRYVREILVMPQPGPHDALVADTADHLAGVFQAKVTFVRFVPDTASEIEAQSAVDYLEELSGLCEAEPSLRIVRGTKEVYAIAAITSSYDMLLMGASHELKLTDSLFGTREDRITAKAACSVLRLKTPRDRAHPAMEGDRVRATVPALKLTDYMNDGVLQAGLPILDKEGLFNHIAGAFADVVPDATHELVLEALEEREESQNTGVGRGVALPHATLASADHPHLGVFVVPQPLEYDAADGVPVDVFFATVGPPSERNTHLMLLATLSRNVLKTDLLTDLRAASCSDDIRSAFDRAHGVTE